MEKGGGMSCFKILFQGDSITDCGRMREDTAGCCPAVIFMDGNARRLSLAFSAIRDAGAHRDTGKQMTHSVPNSFICACLSDWIFQLISASGEQMPDSTVLPLLSRSAAFSRSVDHVRPY